MPRARKQTSRASPLATSDGRIECMAGVSRAGKTAFVAMEIAGEKRRIAWDAHDQWSAMPGWDRVTSPREFFSRLDKGNQSIAYVPTLRYGSLRDQFDAFARIARFWIVHHGPGVVVVEELSDVTTIAKAPDAWGYFLREVLKRGGVVYCIAQRWAEADKTALSQRTGLVVFAQGRDADIDYLAREMRIDREAIAALVPEYDAKGRARRLPYLRQDRTRVITPGALEF